MGEEGEDGSEKEGEEQPNEAMETEQEPPREYSADHLRSVEVVEKLIKLVKKCRVLNHMNLNGLNLTMAGPLLLELIKQLAECPYLMAIHLNDNGIWTAEFLELNNLIDLFGIISDEIADEKLRRVVIDRPRLARNLSSMVTVSQKREVSPVKP